MVTCINHVALYMFAAMTEREAEPDASGCRDKRLDRSITIRHRVRVSGQRAGNGTGADDNSQRVTRRTQPADNCSRLMLTIQQLSRVNSVLSETQHCWTGSVIKRPKPFYAS